VNGSRRPGVEKITFIPHPITAPAGAFLTLTNFFTDRFMSNGVTMQQTVARVILQPDFLFSAGDVNRDWLGFFNVIRTGTTNWINDATTNGSQNGEGPGVIRPQVQIVYDKFGDQFLSYGSSSDEQAIPLVEYENLPVLPSWGSFDGSTNPIVTYPIVQTGTNQMTVRLLLAMGYASNFSKRAFEWKPTSLSGATFTLQTSTNLASWVSLFTVTNDGSVVTYYVDHPASRSRFYRLIPQ
jgi:hypothetical protein